MLSAQNQISVVLALLPAANHFSLTSCIWYLCVGLIVAKYLDYIVPIVWLTEATKPQACHEGNLSICLMIVLDKYLSVCLSVTKPWALLT